MAPRPDGRWQRAVARAFDRVCAEHGDPNRREIADAIVGEIVDETRRSGRFVVPGLGVFREHRSKGRTARIPTSSIPVRVAPRTVLKFRATADANRRLRTGARS
jgi:nucleoid DNA-binding protein